MAKELRVNHGPVDPDITLTEAERDWLRSWNRQGEIPGEDGPEQTDPLDPNNLRADATGVGDAGQYDDLSIDDLKDALRERDLPVSGNKAALIERLTEDDESPDDDDGDADDEE